MVWEVRSGLGSVAVSWGRVGPCRLLAVGEAWSVSCARFGIPGTWASLGGLSEPGPSMSCCGQGYSLQVLGVSQGSGGSPMVAKGFKGATATEPPGTVSALSQQSNLNSRVLSQSAALTV